MEMSERHLGIILGIKELINCAADSVELLTRSDSIVEENPEGPIAAKFDAVESAVNTARAAICSANSELLEKLS